MPLDHEPQRPKEDEVATATRVLERVLVRYPRAFDWVPPIMETFRTRDCPWWDFPDLVSWPEVKTPPRVIRSLAAYSLRRQLDNKDEIQVSDWAPVTTLPPSRVPVERAVGLGHQEGT